MFFMNIDRNIYHIENLLDDLLLFVKENEHDNYELIIGTDSQRKGLDTTNVTVVFLWNLDTRKFRLFYTKDVIKHNKHIGMANRLINEVAKSLEVATLIEDSKVVNIIGKDSISIHIDIGYKGKSNIMINTCTGMVRGSGFSCQVKPDSWVASTIADRFTK